MSNPTYIQLRGRTDKQLLDRTEEIENFMVLNTALGLNFANEHLELEAIEHELDIRDLTKQHTIVGLKIKMENS